jgi:N-dimethylarginine dimethylaminohydrolase
VISGVAAAILLWYALVSGLAAPPSIPKLRAAVLPQSAASTGSAGPAELRPAGFRVRDAATFDGAAIVSDDGGPIAEVLLHYSADSDAELGPVFRDLFASLPAGVRIQVCCPSQASVEFFAQEWGPLATANGRDVHVVNINRPISVWARDRRIARQQPSAQPAASFVPTAHTTYDDEKHNDLLLQTLLWPTGLVPPVALTSFYLEGGNIVSNRRHLFVGGNLFVENENRFSAADQLSSELMRLFGRPLVALKGGDGEPPWCHVDMYLTPFDDRTLLVANPLAGAALLAEEPAPAVMLDAQPPGKSEVLTYDPMAPGSEIQQRFDDVAAQVARLGYKVYRLPALTNVAEDWMVTYNNVLMDRDGDRRIVYMPIYQIPELDRAAEQVYRDLGCEVHPIDVSHIYDLGGAVRCLVNVTLRKPVGTRPMGIEPVAPGTLHFHEVDAAPPREVETRAVDSTHMQRPLSDAFGAESIEEQ